MISHFIDPVKWDSLLSWFIIFRKEGNVIVLWGWIGRFLLCSDGLWGEVEDGAIAEILAREDPTDAARQLVDLVKETGYTEF